MICFMFNFLLVKFTSKFLLIFHKYHKNHYTATIAIPSNPHQCDKEVKATFPSHHACSKSRSVHKSGSYLNQYVKCTSITTTPKENPVFQSQKKYKIFMTLNLLLDASIKKIPRIKKKHQQKIVLADNTQVVRTREERYRARAIA